MEKLQHQLLLIKVCSSITKYKLISHYNQTSLILASPITGEKHQIRKHFSIIGHPIIGDENWEKKKIILTFFCIHLFLNFKMKTMKLLV